MKNTDLRYKIIQSKVDLERTVGLSLQHFYSKGCCRQAKKEPSIPKNKIGGECKTANGNYNIKIAYINFIMSRFSELLILMNAALC